VQVDLPELNQLDGRRHERPGTIPPRRPQPLEPAGTVLLTIFSIAVSVTLLLVVERVRTEARASFANTISGTDLIVGARSGDLNLLLYSVFRIGNATNNITWPTYQELAIGARWPGPSRCRSAIRTGDSACSARRRTTTSITASPGIAGWNSRRGAGGRSLRGRDRRRRGTPARLHARPARW
jgi:hypothetical protein